MATLTRKYMVSHAPTKHEPSYFAQTQHRGHSNHAEGLPVCAEDFERILACKKVHNKPTTAIEHATHLYYELLTSRS